jgi:predicted Fe-S protein YdhL (DUF1289 family)
MSQPPSTVQSPCVRNCCLGDDLICLGCFRSIEEIKEWGLVGDDRRRAILQSARRRKEAAPSFL